MKRTIDAAEEGTTHKRARADYVASIVKEVRPSDVPKYLHSSDFYKALNIEGDEVFYLPSNYMKQNLTVETVQDACDLLHTVRFWGSDVSLLPIVKFTLQNENSAHKSELSEFAKEVPLIPSSGKEALGVCVQYLILYNFRITASLATILKYNDKPELFKLALQHGCSVDVDVAVYCAETGNLHYGCKPSSDILIAAAAQGQLQCMKFARQAGCAWSAKVCTMAARGGHLDCLKYAREHGCPWDNSVFLVVRDCGHSSVVEYATRNGCSGAPYYAASTRK